MTIQLSALRVSADLNVSDYTKPMNEKVADDEAGAASSETLGAALVSTDTKISQSGDILTQLQRKYKDGAKESSAIFFAEPTFLTTRDPLSLKFARHGRISP